MLWGIKPVNQQAAYGLAVERLRRQIHLGFILPGERIPAERKLSEELDVSRVTLREALRILETEGYLSVKRGAHGGAFISDEDQLREMALKRIALDPAAVMRAFEFREANLRIAARMAATRRTPGDLRKMKDAAKAIKLSDTGSELRRAETSYELALVEASQNQHFAHAIEEALASLFLPFPKAAISETREAALFPREALITAIEKRDEQEAERYVSEIISKERSRFQSLPKVA